MQKAMSGELANRQFLLRPPEPTPGLLVSSPSESVYVGKTQLLHVPFFWDPKKLVNPHICVVGITGSGKSYFVKTFITRARLVFGTSALILDWAGEYADWVRSAGGRVISFGQDGLNLLDLGGASRTADRSAAWTKRKRFVLLPAGPATQQNAQHSACATPHARTRQVVASLEMLTDLSSFPPQRRMTEDAIERAYAAKGFSLHAAAQQKKRAPTLQDVHMLLAKNAKKSQDAAEAARRIKTLLLSSGKSFSSSTIGMGALLSGLVCVDLHSLPSESLRSLAGLAILQFVKEKMRAESFQPEGRPRLFVVADEAWKIASDERSDVISIIREGRKYGFGLVVASQNPTDVHRSIFSNAGTTLCFRLTLSSERDYVRSSLTYSDYYERASHSMAVGQALVHLEMAAPTPCPRNFILEKVDGEPLRTVARISGGGMDIELEKDSLAHKLRQSGMTEKQAASLLAEFERRSFTLGATEFVSAVERFGHGRAATVSLLRELGAEEKDLLQLFASQPGKRGAKRVVLEIEPSRRKAAKKKKRRVG